MWIVVLGIKTKPKFQPHFWNPNWISFRNCNLKYLFDQNCLCMTYSTTDYIVSSHGYLSWTLIRFDNCYDRNFPYLKNMLCAIVLSKTQRNDVHFTYSSVVFTQQTYWNRCNGIRHNRIWTGKNWFNIWNQNDGTFSFVFWFYILLDLELICASL